MFQVDHVLLSDDIATVEFACDVPVCKGACCEVGDAGAPVEKSEVAVLKKAYRFLKDELRPEAVKEVEENGLIKVDADGGLELACSEDGACVFVVRDKNNIATCAIQKAFFEKRFEWEKPISCHLFPIRVKKAGEYELANYQYVPSLCWSARLRGKREGIYLSDFLSRPLARKYGEKWVKKFLIAAKKIRESVQK